MPTHIPKDFDWPKLQSAWYQGKAHGGTALAVTKALGCPAGTSSGTPNAPAVESVTLAQGPKEDPESKHETGQDKDPEGHKEEVPNSKVESEEKQSGPTALAMTQVAKKNTMAGSPSSTPNAPAVKKWHLGHGS